MIKPPIGSVINIVQQLRHENFDEWVLITSFVNAGIWVKNTHFQFYEAKQFSSMIEMACNVKLDTFLSCHCVISEYSRSFENVH